ncbi:hypothetical protein GCM10023189_35050 [Nibrella saemangeumensis]|uniref:7TM diverse intracellular signalling n=1 Tax=Nibrella saemangeumensis TaxID=1084526 RepID=A0ABP8N5F8_9BACT
MTYESWFLLFMGMMIAMWLFNMVQWFFYRDRIHSLYSIYMLIWIGYFSLRRPAGDTAGLSEAAFYFFRVVTSMVAFFVYYDFANVFLNMRENHPKLLRLFRTVQGIYIVYWLGEVVICFMTDYWQRPIHVIINAVVRILSIFVAGYVIAVIFKRRDTVARLFITGTLMLLIGGILALVIGFITTTTPEISMWKASQTYLQIGIVLELIFFSFGLTYRHRQEAVNKAVLEQTLDRERDQHQRKQLEAELAVQQLRQEMNEVRMRALQSQISPHFLFNSLNSLSSLIADEPQKAEQFVDEMSTVYRYLLQTSERELTTLETEIGFITSYYHLLKTRYGQGFDLTIDIPNKCKNCLLPPLTLQLLVENAVKHNIVSADHPLHIRIYSDSNNGTLTVSNNLQRRSSSGITSTQKGLLNITAKYKLLNQPDIQILETDKEFTVVVPLIRPQPA